MKAGLVVGRFLACVAASAQYGCADDNDIGALPSLPPTQMAAFDGGVGAAGGGGGGAGPGSVGGGTAPTRRDGGFGGAGGGMAPPDPGGGPGGGMAPEGESLFEHASRTCFNAGDPTPPELLEGLSHQLVRAIDCLRPGALSDLPAGNWQMLEPLRRPLVDGRGVDDLLAAAGEGASPMVIRWAYRDVAIQHLFYLWTLTGCDFAAPPGLSNHQNGLSVDLQDADAWVGPMSRHGWENNLPTDRPHFDYGLADDEGMAGLSLFAFQALWNLNRSDRAIPLTGEFDAATELALGDAPLLGFARDLCDDGRPDVPEPPQLGPAVAQAAWRGCEAPVAFIEGLSAQIVEVMRCSDPGAVDELRLCAEPGCVVVVGPPKPEWLEAATHRALLAASRALGRPIGIEWALREPALTWFDTSVADNLSCAVDPTPPQTSAYTSGRAVALGPPADEATAAALSDAGFAPIDERGGWLYAGGEDLRALGVYAFQALWNANRPDDPLDADGVLGPATLGAIDRAPIRGFPRVPCERGEVPDGPDPVACVPDCFNQDCPGTYDFCTVARGVCEAVPCDGDGDCVGLAACDDPARGSPPVFYCDDGHCRRQR